MLEFTVSVATTDSFPNPNAIQTMLWISFEIGMQPQDRLSRNLGIENLRKLHQNQNVILFGRIWFSQVKEVTHSGCKQHLVCRNMFSSSMCYS